MQQQWEYKTGTIYRDPHKAQSQLNAQGKEGWECFHITDYSPNPALQMAFFKRPGTAPAEQVVTVTATELPQGTSV